MSDRKYRQSGYQDDGSRGERPRENRPPAERKEGPRGRGLGAPTETVFRCVACGAKQPSPPAAEAYGASCWKCQAPLHTCSHCSAFDTSTFRECRKTLPARVVKKTLANQCALFEPKLSVEFAQEQAPEKPSDAKAAFDALFKF